MDGENDGGREERGSRARSGRGRRPAHEAASLSRPASDPRLYKIVVQKIVGQKIVGIVSVALALKK